MIDFNNIIRSSKYKYDEENLSKYLDFVNINSVNKIDKDNNNLYEHHHILPRSLFKKYIKNKDNIVLLKCKDHLEAHYLLYKLFSTNKKIIYALNIMINRIDYDINEINDFDKDQYAKFRKKVSNIISKTNTGKVHDDNFRKNVSNRIKNTVVVKDKFNNTFRVSRDDIRYKSGELVFYRIGYKHKDDTIIKIKNNGVKGRTTYNNGLKTKYLFEPTEEFNILGRTEDFKNKCKLNNKKIFIYNDETEEQRRISKDDVIPNGFVNKRIKKGNFNGFENINNKTKVFDISINKFLLIDKDKVNYDYQIPYYGLKKDRRYLIELDNFYFYNMLYFAEYLKNKYNIIINVCECNSVYMFYKVYNNYIIKKPHFNMNKEYKIFCEDNQNKYLKDLIKINIYFMENLVYNINNKIYKKEV